MPVIHFLRLAIACVFALAACGGGRTSLRTLDAADAAKAPPDGARSATPDARANSDRALAWDGPGDLPREGLRDLACAGADCPAPSSCAPVSEICNGIDDDCDGAVDNDIAPIPCPGGGFRYCVAGQMSTCPTRCPVCVPGGQRVCFISYCSYWGLQTCASDGQSWSYCVEQRPVPSACASVASDKKHAPETEQCCIDNGFCCLDEFDLNHNGDTTELLGRCGDVLCVQ